MERDEHNNLIATEAEWNADLRGILQQAFSEYVGVRVLNEDGNVVWSVGCGQKPPSLEEERERLRDAVVEAAGKLEDTYASLWTGDGTELVGDFRERMNVAMYGVINASHALREHERKAGG